MAYNLKFSHHGDRVRHLRVNVSVGVVFAAAAAESKDEMHSGSPDILCGKVK